MKTWREAIISDYMVGDDHWLLIYYILARFQWAYIVPILYMARSWLLLCNHKTFPCGLPLFPMVLPLRIWIPLPKATSSYLQLPLFTCSPEKNIRQMTQRQEMEAVQLMSRTPKDLLRTTSMNGPTLFFDNPSMDRNFVSRTWPPTAATTMDEDPSVFSHHLTYISCKLVGVKWWLSAWFCYCRIIPMEKNLQPY